MYSLRGCMRTYVHIERNRIKNNNNKRENRQPIMIREAGRQKRHTKNTFFTRTNEI